MKRAVLVAFSICTKKFKSNYERSMFFRYLYGWKQIVTKGEREYTYRREGLLDRVRCKRIDQSSFIVIEDDFDKVEEFFRRWGEKVIFKTLKIILDEDIFEDEP